MKPPLLPTGAQLYCGDCPKDEDDNCYKVGDFYHCIKYANDRRYKVLKGVLDETT